MKLTRKNISRLFVGTVVSLFSLPVFAPVPGFIERNGESELYEWVRDPNKPLYYIKNGEVLSVPGPCLKVTPRPATLYYNPVLDHNRAFAGDYFGTAGRVGDPTQPVFIYGAHGAKPQILAPRGVIDGTGSDWNMRWNSVEQAGYNAGKQYIDWSKRNNIPVGKAPISLASCYSYENAPLFTRGLNRALNDAGHQELVLPWVSAEPNVTWTFEKMQLSTVNPKTTILMDKYYGCPSKVYQKLYHDSFAPDPVMRSTTTSRVHGNAVAGGVLLAYLGLQVGHASQAIRQARENDRTAQQKSMMYDRPGVEVTDEVDAWRNDPMNPSRHFYGANPEHAMERNQRYYAHDGEGNWLKKRPGCKWWQY